MKLGEENHGYEIKKYLKEKNIEFKTEDDWLLVNNFTDKAKIQ